MAFRTPGLWQAKTEIFAYRVPSQAISSLGETPAYTLQRGSRSNEKPSESVASLSSPRMGLEGASHDGAALSGRAGRLFGLR